ncbi:MAG TPA: helicase-related protein, partial [Nocardioides sp.]|nr:helicase-related protein [Nocardioides sp.]
RGIHVDDVALVIHADPPVEHKAYTHRSGRTARAGASGTVITLMTDDQVRDVRDLTRKAGVNPTTTRVTSTHPLLQQLAPGERSFAGGLTLSEPARSGGGGGRGRGAGGRSGSARSGGGQAGAPRAGQGGGNGQRRRGAGSSTARPASARPASARPASARPARSAASFSEGASRRSR